MNHLVLLSALAFAARAYSQTALTGGLSGVLTDDRGGRSIPHASVTVKSSTLSLKQEVRTDDSGRFRILGLPPSSDYKLTFAAEGFETATRRDIPVNSSALGRSSPRLLSKTDPRQFVAEAWRVGRCRSDGSFRVAPCRRLAAGPLGCWIGTINCATA